MAGGKKTPEKKGAGKHSMRETAEKKIAEMPGTSPDLAGRTTEQLIHELWVHQIELETQAEELRRAHLVLEESRDKYLDLYEFAPIGYLTLTYNALIWDVNLSGATLLGTDRIRLERARFRKFIAPGDLDTWDRYFMDVLQHENKQTTTIRLRRGDGSTFPARLESIRLTGPDVGATMVRVAIIDITDITKVELELRKTNKVLTLLSSITRHDINNQLTSVNGFLELLHQKVHDPELEDYFTRIMNASTRISAMIQFTKEYEQIGVSDPVWQDCRGLVDTVVREAPPVKITVKNDLPAGTEVFADPLITRVCFNLLDNAVRHGGKITTIRFSSEKQDGNHIIICEDDGTGIPDDEKEKIFERGFGKNTGLGLFFAREILDITGITIRETGEPGRGARFEMMVPEGAWRIAGA